MCGLPHAFEVASKELLGNPAIGLIREHILIGFFITEFGEKEVVPEESGTARSSDLMLCGKPLSIKTIKGSGLIKILWTADSVQIGRELEKYSPDCDMFLVNIFWGKERDSIFYIPAEVQKSLYSSLKDKYFRIPVGTNHRGINISKEAMEYLKADNRTLRQSVSWIEKGVQTTPYKRWQDFWKNYV